MEINRKYILNFIAGGTVTMAAYCASAALASSARVIFNKSTTIPETDLTSIIDAPIRILSATALAVGLQLTTKFIGRKITKINPDNANTYGSAASIAPSALIHYGISVLITKRYEDEIYSTLVTSLFVILATLTTHTLYNRFTKKNNLPPAQTAVSPA
ncbi:MAG: hypothetical protein K1060chlam5_00870 [Candidatus Anoxychlamydiales bacterium]|nr:hypothetical protein [Candidatus Anoxychlamydiales bacterium]